MKNFGKILVLVTMLVSLNGIAAFAAETDTDCPSKTDATKKPDAAKVEDAKAPGVVVAPAIVPAKK